MPQGRRFVIGSIATALAGLSTACVIRERPITIYSPYSVVSLVILILDIWAIVKIIQGSASTGEKLLWILLILFLPVVGLVLWLLLGRK